MSDDLRDELEFPALRSTERVYDGAVWGVRRETFAFGDASITREFVDHTGAVAVLAFDERDRVLLIKQYRHPVRAREWELPAGLLDVAGESALIGAQRELAEEVDLVAERWDLLIDFVTSPGGSNEALRIYLARGLSSADEVFHRTEEEADMESRWVPLDELVEAILSGSVQNSILVIGALAAQAARDRGWETLGDANAPWTRHPSAFPAAFPAAATGQ